MFSLSCGNELTNSKLPVAAMSTATCCRNHTFLGKRVIGNAAAPTWCQLSWRLNLVPKYILEKEAKMIMSLST